MTENTLRYKIFNEITEDLENLWIEFEKNNNHHFFQKLAIIKNQLNIKKKNRYLFIIIYLEEKIIAILPFEIESKFSFKILQWIGTKEFDYCGAIFSNFEQIGINKQDFLILWNKILDEIKNFDLVLLNKQFNEIDNVPNPFVKYLKTLNKSKIFLIKLPKNETEYFNNIENKKFINEFSRTEKKLLENNTVEFKHYSSNDNKIKPSDIIKKKAEILKTQKKNNFLDQSMMEFFDNLQKKHPDFLKLSVIEINKQIVAANIGLVNNFRFYYYMPVLFTNKFNKFSPGKILIKSLIKWNIDNDMKTFDFGLGDENYKKYWSNSSNILSVHLDFKSIKGLILYLFVRCYLFLKNN